MKVTFNRSNLTKILLKDSNHVLNLSTAPLFLYDSLSNLKGLPILCLFLFLLFTGIFDFIPLILRYFRISIVSYAESAFISSGQAF